MTLTAQKAQEYILNSIDGANYDQITETDQEKIEFLIETFKSEYGWAIERMGTQKAIEEWLRGLPSAIQIDFYNSDIIDLAKSWGTLRQDATEREEDKILANYWNLLANHILQLAKKYKVEV